MREGEGRDERGEERDCDNRQSADVKDVNVVAHDIINYNGPCLCSLCHHCE